MSPLRTTTHEFRRTVPDPVDVVSDRHGRPGAFPRLMPLWQPVRVVQETQDLAGPFLVPVSLRHLLGGARA